MNNNFTNKPVREEILEENVLYQVLESKVIFKNDKEKVSFNIDQISGVRLVKNKDFSGNIMLLLFLILLDILVLFPINSVFDFIKLFFITVFLILVCRIKKHSHKILINIGSYGFNEILISKKNLSFANVFISKFMIDNNKNIKLEI